jgi:uncharacterized protein (TIGR01244 family)
MSEKTVGKNLTLIFGLILSTSFVIAGEADLSAVRSLKVDLDAVVAQGEVVPVDGITSAGQPDEAGFRVFAENGYVAVIDIRTEGEDRGLDEPAIVTELGMEYVLFPVGRSDITFKKAEELAALLEQHDGPVLVHCASGNRVGALLALQAFNETGDAEHALETGRAGGMTRLEGTVRELIEAQ